MSCCPASNSWTSLTPQRFTHFSWLGNLTELPIELLSGLQAARMQAAWTGEHTARSNAVHCGNVLLSSCACGIFTTVSETRQQLLQFTRSSRGAGLPPPSPPFYRPCRRMLALAQALLAWAPQAAEAPPALLVSPDGRPPLVLQFCSGCNSVCVLANLADRLRMQPAAAFRIAAACQMVFDVGRRITPVIAAAVESDAAAGQHADPVMLGMLNTLSVQQLDAVVGCLRLLFPGRLRAVEAAFVRSTARPAVLVPWLAEVSRAVLALRDWREGASGRGREGRAAGRQG